MVKSVGVKFEFSKKFGVESGNFLGLKCKKIEIQGTKLEIQKIGAQFYNFKNLFKLPSGTMPHGRPELPLYLLLPLPRVSSLFLCWKTAIAICYRQPTQHRHELTKRDEEVLKHRSSDRRLPRRHCRGVAMSMGGRGNVELRRYFE